MLVDHGKTRDHSQEKFQGVITVKCVITVKAVITPAIINLFSGPENIRRRLYDKHSTFLFQLTYSKHKIQFTNEFSITSVQVRTHL